jgi:LysR family transcriptional regulator, regulator of abg operon
MRLTQIRDFIAVVECGSVRGAARKLGVAQPTISKSVRALESELHVQLLGRNSRGIVPTPAGRAFFAHARAAHSELRKAEEEVAQFDGSAANVVALGIGPAGVSPILPAAIARFREQFPRARIRIVEGLAHQLLPFVRDETLDFIIGLRQITPLDPALKFRPLYRSDLVIAARKRHPLSDARSLADLASAEWLTTATLGLPGAPFERLFAGNGLTPPNPVIQCASYNAAATLLARSDMLGLIQRRVLKEPAWRERLQEISVTQPIPSVTAGMFTRADSPLTRAAAALAKAVITSARALTRPD